MNHPFNPNSNRSERRSPSNTDWIDRLDSQDQDRVVAILDRYLVDLENGISNSVDSILAENPDLAEPLRASLESIRLLSRIHDTPDLERRDRSANSLGGKAPKNISGYSIERELGRGAMGVVYSATMDSTGDEVAIKFLDTHGVRAQDSIERFRREAKAAESLNHPNIVPVYDIGSGIGEQYYTMKLIDGESLSRRIDTAFQRTDASRYFAPNGAEYYQSMANEMSYVADALHSAHTMGIVHRDVKPSNLLIDREDHIWITDFGLAHVEDGLDLTYSGDIIGTFQYMSPEQASGKRERVDCRSDIYSFGATLYELFTGYAPFHGLSRAEILSRIQKTEPLRPASFNRNLPRDLETIIRRAMRPERSDRYQSAALVAEDLRRFSKGQPILANKVGLSERVRNWTSANSSQLAAALLIAVFAIVVLAVYNVQMGTEKKRTADALRSSEQHYRQARTAVDSLGLRFAEQLSSLSGTEKLRREMLDETLRYYEVFVSSANSDPRLAYDVAQTKLKIAQLTRVLGSVEEADVAYSQAISSLRELLREKYQVEIASTLHLAINEWVLLRSRQGDQSFSNQLMTEAKSLAEAIPELDRRERALALSHHTQSIIAFRENNIDKAIEESTAAITILQGIETRDSTVGQRVLPKTENDEITDNYLADALINLSVLLGEAGKNGPAEAAAAQGLALQRKALALAETPEAIKRLALACDNSASALWRNGRTQEAIELYKKAIAHLDRACSLASPAFAPRRELSISLNNLGMACSSLNQYTEANDAFRRAIAIAGTAADSDLNDTGASQRAAGMWNNLGVLMKNNGNKAVAAAAFQKASEYQLRVCKLLPEHAEETGVLKQIQENLSSL